MSLPENLLDIPTADYTYSTLSTVAWCGTGGAVAGGLVGFGAGSMCGFCLTALTAIVGTANRDSDKEILKVVGKFTAVGTLYGAAGGLAIGAIVETPGLVYDIASRVFENLNSDEVCMSLPENLLDIPTAEPEKLDIPTDDYTHSPLSTVAWCGTGGAVAGGLVGFGAGSMCGFGLAALTTIVGTADRDSDKEILKVVAAYTARGAQYGAAGGLAIGAIVETPGLVYDAAYRVFENLNSK